ncbi:MAG: SOS response-associated peptidase [Gemmataceae bacterium]
MCGRFTRTKTVKEVARLFELAEPPPELAPRYNIAPTQQAAVVGLKPDGVTRGLIQIRWGLVREERHLKGAPLVNARAETADTRPTFSDLLESRRCLVVADGFVEWRKNHPGKDPHLFRLASDEPFAFAGLWDVWHPAAGGKPILSFCILTTEPNELLKQLHDRMPVILRPDEFGRWLDPGAGTAGVRPLLDPYPADEMTAVPLTTRINSPRNDDAACLEPLHA